jgi:hypothetical protein
MGKAEGVGECGVGLGYAVHNEGLPDGKDPVNLVTKAGRRPECRAFGYSDRGSGGWKRVE